VHFHFASAVCFVHINKFDQRPIVHVMIAPSLLES
jgi:hypothetical protein